MQSDTSQNRTQTPKILRTCTENQEVNVVSENSPENEASEFKPHKAPTSPKSENSRQTEEEKKTTSGRPFR